MLSVVVVGRNDSHGYNLSKRVATSLNSISLPMSGEDELIFVDWNSDDINPTFIDAIRDTLTEKTLKHLVVYRVRTSTHKKLAGKVNRPILEPIARNVGIRRAKNPWILSTNTDMIFNLNGKTYAELLESLEPNLYHLFRFEIPEYVWDQFNRQDPKGTLDAIKLIFRHDSLTSKILTRPYDGYPNLFPDAVGDFQLAPSEFWNRVQGFPEDMLKGWHVDSRLSVQIEKELNQRAKILDSKKIVGYHQDHLRVPTHFHTQTLINSVDIIGIPYRNSDTWGLNNIELEADLTSRLSIFNSRKHSINKSDSNLIVRNLQEMHDIATYDSRIVDTFLMDDLVNLPINSKVFISSVDADFGQRLINQYQDLFLTGPHWQVIDSHDFNLATNADFCILDFGIPESMLENIQISYSLPRIFEEVLDNNSKILLNMLPGQRLAVIKTQHWAIRSLVHQYCAVPLFNNYPTLLSGYRSKTTIPKSKYFINQLLQILKLRIVKELYLLSLTSEAKYTSVSRSQIEEKRLEDFLLKPRISRYVDYYKGLPLFVRKRLNPLLRKILRAF